MSEIIGFTDQSSISISWTEDRKSKFGTMPIIEVWLLDGSNYSLSNMPIKINGLPPLMTEINIDLTSITTGFILLK